MRFYKYIKNGYIVTIGKGNGGVEITEDEYDMIYDLIQNRPAPPEGYGYKLKEDCTWEQYELPIIVEGEVVE